MHLFPLLQLTPNLSVLCFLILVYILNAMYLVVTFIRREVDIIYYDDDEGL